jgi:hypothetical protein
MKDYFCNNSVLDNKTDWAKLGILDCFGGVVASIEDLVEFNLEEKIANRPLCNHCNQGMEYQWDKRQTQNQTHFKCLDCGVIS